MHRRALLTSLAPFGLAPTNANCQPFGHAITLPIGSELLQIPTPRGFVETSRRSQELWNLALALTAGDARIVAHFVAETDLRAFEAGKTVQFSPFMLIQTPRRAESIVVSQAQFDKLRVGTVDLQRNLTEKLTPRIAAELDKVSKAVSSARATDIKVRVGEVVPVSVDRNDARVLIYTVLSRGSVAQGNQGKDENVIASTAYCFLRAFQARRRARRGRRNIDALQGERQRRIDRHSNGARKKRARMRAWSGIRRRQW